MLLQALLSDGVLFIFQFKEEEALLIIHGAGEHHRPRDSQGKRGGSVQSRLLVQPSGA